MSGTDLRKVYNYVIDNDSVQPLYEMGIFIPPPHTHTQFCKQRNWGREQRHKPFKVTS